MLYCCNSGTETIVVNVIVVVEALVTWSKYYHCAVSVVVVEPCSA